jgi:hypothetical protein
MYGSVTALVQLRRFVFMNGRFAPKAEVKSNGVMSTLPGKYLSAGLAILSETGADKESSLNAIIGGNLPNVSGLTINLRLSID